MAGRVSFVHLLSLLILKNVKTALVTGVADTFVPILFQHYYYYSLKMIIARPPVSRPSRGPTTTAAAATTTKSPKTAEVAAPATAGACRRSSLLAGCPRRVEPLVKVSAEVGGCPLQLSLVLNLPSPIFSGVCVCVWSSAI